MTDPSAFDALYGAQPATKGEKTMQLTFEGRELFWQQRAAQQWVDVLRQRIRVSYGPGDTEVLPATEVKPMFPSGNQQQRGQAPESYDEGPDTDEPDMPTS